MCGFADRGLSAPAPVGRAAALLAPDYYKTLGVDKKATAKEIKAAYYDLAKKHHPDTKPGLVGRSALPPLRRRAGASHGGL